MARSLLPLVVLWASLWSPRALAQDSETTAEAPAALQRPARLEFDDRLVRGQSADVGAIYLFERKPRPLPPLVPVRRSFRDHSVAPLLGPAPREAHRPAEPAQPEDSTP